MFIEKETDPVFCIPKILHIPKINSPSKPVFLTSTQERWMAPVLEEEIWIPSRPDVDFELISDASGSTIEIRAIPKRKFNGWQ